MILNNRRYVAILLAVTILGAPSHADQVVGKWERTVIELTSAGYEGNSFELIVDATFTNLGTDTSLTIPAYFAGGDTWKVGFMPTEIGRWQYSVKSPLPKLNEMRGSLTVVPSGSAGMLAADPENPRKWKFSDGIHVLPIALRMDFFFEESGIWTSILHYIDTKFLVKNSISPWESAVDFLATDLNAHLFDTRLQDEGSRNMDVFSGRPENHRFDLDKWDQMEQRMDALAKRGVGAYIMFYADDAGKPKWPGQSSTEALLIRYAVARLSAYPVVIWDIGIDIAEYRGQADINWFGDQIRRLDPYGHLVASRTGGGKSGRYSMEGRTYDSYGARQAHVEDMIEQFNETTHPIAMTDSFAEENPRTPSKNFQPADIRRAMWKGIMAGGIGIFIRGSDGYFHIDSVREDLESEQWIRLVNPFIQERLGDTFGQMVPNSELVANGYSLSDPDHSKILYWVPGEFDTWDRSSRADLSLRLTEVPGDYQGVWFDPRTGLENAAGIFRGGTEIAISLPSTDDWLLLLTRVE